MRISVVLQIFGDKAKYMNKVYFHLIMAESNR